MNIKQGAEEYDLKAAYIFNITKFIYWDETIKEDEFLIGILGTSSIYEPLLELARTKTVNDKKIVIEKYTKLDEIKDCNILFISKNTSVSLEDILATAKKEKILTISEQTGYGAKGVTINFITVNNKLKFEVNVKSLESLGLKASAQFLKLAIIIE